MISEQTAIEGLHQCLLELGQTQSNPVLAILPEPDQIKQGVKYPAGNLLFAETGLRAYYHSHAEPYIRKNEHGHFHIFIADSSAQESPVWSHLAALSVDSMGQPQSWFCVNNWVTGGKWLPADSIKTLLLTLFQQNQHQITEQFILVERWIFYMLAVYYHKLLGLLTLRDCMLSDLSAANDVESILNDRSVYDLAETAIDLLGDLSIMAE